MKVTHVFVDLDECLVSTIYKVNGAVPKNRIKITLKNGWLDKDEIYWSALRPGALDFLQYCRGIAPTYILTAAATDYAQKHNEVFSLGFTDDMIIGRDKYVYHRSGMVADTIRATKVDQYPDSILVDNQQPRIWGSENLHIKMSYLGIKENRLVKSREYMGGMQPPDFRKEIQQIQNILDQNG
jgi:NLI interacting factor-like phosphatase